MPKPAQKPVNPLTDIKTRAAAATPGPWHPTRVHLDHRQHEAVTIRTSGRFPIIASTGIVGQHPDSRPDAEFIAHARTDVDWLVSEVERLQAERNELHNHVSNLVYAANGVWSGAAIEPVAPQVERAWKAIIALGEDLDEARADADHAEAEVKRLRELLACECNGGKPCECPDCECPDCSYQQPEAEPAPVCGEGNPVCGEPVPNGFCSEHGEVGPPQAPQPENTTDDRAQWNPGDLAMTELNYIWRRDTDGWRPYARTTDSPPFTDTELHARVGPFIRIASAPAGTTPSGLIPAATAAVIREQARNGTWCQPCADYIPRLSTHWHCDKCGRITGMVGHVYRCPPDTTKDTPQ